MAGSKKRARFNRLRVDPAEAFLILMQNLLTAVVLLIIVLPAVVILNDVATRFKEHNRSTKRAADTQMDPARPSAPTDRFTTKAQRHEESGNGDH